MNWDELQDVIDAHHWDLSQWDVHKPLNRCTCGQDVGNDPHEFTAHLAAAIRAWVEGQMRKESTSYPPTHATVFRRYVTDWTTD